MSEIIGKAYKSLIVDCSFVIRQGNGEYLYEVIQHSDPTKVGNIGTVSVNFLENSCVPLIIYGTELWRALNE